MKPLKHSFLLLYLLLASLLATGQRTGTVYGTLSDTINHLPPKDARISLRGISDSTIQQAFIPGENGTFSSVQLPWGNYYISIVYQNHETIHTPFTLNKPQLDLGTIYVHPKIMVLDTVVIQEQAIVQNKDTLEYNASRFKTRDYANLSELLELLPGMQINNDGTITINGQVIDKLMVDGKPFFDGTPAMALTHLPADIVKKIQVFASNNITNNGIPVPPGFPGSKTLNIVLKADKRKGNFGKIMAGTGSGGTYTGSGDINHMNGAQQLSLIGDGGNVNQDKSADGTGIENGIHRSVSGGLNYRDSRNEKIGVNGSITGNELYSKALERTHVLNIFPGDSSTLLDQHSQGETRSNMQQGNLKLEYKPDAFNTFTIQPRINLQHTNNNNFQQSTQRYQTTNDTIYQSTGTNSSERTSTMVSSLLQYTHGWQQPEKKLTLGMNFSGNSDLQHTDGHTETQTTTGITKLAQRNISKNNSLNLSPYLNFMAPVGDKNTLNILVNYAFNRSKMSYNTFRLNDENQHYTEPDSTQSNDFNSTYHTAALQLSLRRQWKKTALTLGSGVESDWIAGQNLTTHTQTGSRFINALPVAMFSYNMKGSNTLMVSYNGKPMALSVQQLQPVAVTADSLFIAEGNPDLQQPYVHSLNLGYTSISQSNNAFFSANLTGSITKHSIQQSVTLLDNGAQVSKPVNLEGAQNASLMINYNLPAIQRKSSLGFAATVTYSKNPVLSNGNNSVSRIMIYTGTITWSYRQPGGLSLNISASPGYNSLQSGTDDTQGFCSAAIIAKGSYIKGDWEATLSAGYNYNGSLPSSYRPKYPVAIPSLSFRCLKHKEGIVRLSVIDLFNQQSGTSRSITASSVSDAWSQTRGRYVLATFTYNFRKFGK